MARTQATYFEPGLRQCSFHEAGGPQDLALGFRVRMTRGQHWFVVED